MIIASVLAVAAATTYTVIYNKKLKEVRASGILDTLDRYGRPLPVVEERQVAQEENVEETSAQSEESAEEK